MATAAAVGDLASVKWAVTLADGKPLPQQGQVFDQGDVRMVVGAGGFLPCLHKKVAGMSVGDKASVDVLPADAFGESNPMMGPVDIPAAQAPAGLEAGMLVQLATGQKARVTQVTADAVTIDANMPLAGAALKMDVELLAVEAGAASLEKADFALGCFWGAELAFQREKGVVSTKVGYTQGAKESPTYEEVCSGKTRARTHAARTHARARAHTHTDTHTQVCSGTTGHTECVQVLFDPKEVSFERLCALFWERLGNDRFKPNQVRHWHGPGPCLHTAVATPYYVGSMRACREGRHARQTVRGNLGLRQRCGSTASCTRSPTTRDRARQTCEADIHATAAAARHFRS